MVTGWVSDRKIGDGGSIFNRGGHGWTGMLLEIGNMKRINIMGYQIA